MFGECHAHIFMNGYNYKEAVELHRGHVDRESICRWFCEYKKRGVVFIRDGGDALGVSEYAKGIAGEYGIDYRTPVFAIHRKGRYGSIVGREFETMKEYRELVAEVKRRGGDFIKIMLSGIMDFNHCGTVTSIPLKKEEICEMIHIAHEEGFAVMAHVNRAQTVKEAALAGVDSVEHGNYLDEECIRVMARQGTLWVPTLATVRNLIGCGRFPDEEVTAIWHRAAKNLRLAYRLGVPLALGSDAGAYLVPHGQGIFDEYEAFREVLGDGERLDGMLAENEKRLKERFQRK